MKVYALSAKIDEKRGNQNILTLKFFNAKIKIFLDGVIPNLSCATF